MHKAAITMHLGAHGTLKIRSSKILFCWFVRVSVAYNSFILCNRINMQIVFTRHNVVWHNANFKIEHHKKNQEKLCEKRRISRCRASEMFANRYDIYGFYSFCFFLRSVTKLWVHFMRQDFLMDPWHIHLLYCFFIFHLFLFCQLHWRIKPIQVKYVCDKCQNIELMWPTEGKNITIPDLISSNVMHIHKNTVDSKCKRKIYEKLKTKLFLFILRFKYQNGEKSYVCVLCSKWIKWKVLLENACRFVDDSWMRAEVENMPLNSKHRWW